MHQNESFRQLTWIAAWGIIAILCLINLNRNKPFFLPEKNSKNTKQNFKQDQIPGTTQTDVVEIYLQETNATTHNKSFNLTEDAGQH